MVDGIEVCGGVEVCDVQGVQDLKTAGSVGSWLSSGEKSLSL